MNKMTNKIALEYVMSLEEVKSNPEVMEKLCKMYEQVCKKNAKSDKPTKAQEENMSIKDDILVAMAQIGKPCQVKDICSLVGYTNQKISALMKQLVNDGLVSRTVDKKVTLFDLICEETEIDDEETEIVEE